MLNLNVNDKILCRKENLDYFTYDKIYTVKYIFSNHAIIIDDENEENFLLTHFLRTNFKKVLVSFNVQDDGNFTTETEQGKINWIDNNYMLLDSLIELLNGLNIGYEIIYE